MAEQQVPCKLWEFPATHGVVRLYIPGKVTADDLADIRTLWGMIDEFLGRMVRAKEAQPADQPEATDEP